jgi:ribosomal protein L11 methyltransferase
VSDDRPWLAVRVEPSADLQTVIDAMFAAGSLGVQEDGSAAVTHFPPGTSLSEIERAILAVDPDARISSAPAPKVTWNEWRASVGSHRMGRIVIAPPWIAGQSYPGTIYVIVEPAMGFGTGEHATTRGVVRLMQQVEMPDVVADLGAGSAVLSISAAKLGAKRVIAVELDHDAIGNAEENVAANHAQDAVTVVEGDASLILPLVAPVGLVLANIISSVLLTLLPVIRDSLMLSGHAILSGILADEREMMLDVLEESGWKMISEDTEEGWWSVLIARPR